MPVDPANAQELAAIAKEIGAEVLQGALRYPSDTGGWWLGELDFCEYLDRYRNQQVMVIIVPLGEAPAPSYTCGICGFVMNELGECPRCKLAIEQGAAGYNRGGDDVLDQVQAFLDGADDVTPPDK